MRDDILDIEGDSATLGKTAGKDVAQGKATFPALIGLEASRARLHELGTAMTDALAPFGERADALTALGDWRSSAIADGSAGYAPKAAPGLAPRLPGAAFGLTRATAYFTRRSVNG